MRFSRSSSASGSLRGRTALTALATIVVSAGAGAACSSEASEPPGQLVVALASDMDLPKDVDQIGIRVLTDGRVYYRGDFVVDRKDSGEGKVQLPATLAVTAGKAATAPITIRVFARQAGKIRVLREAVTVVPTDRVALLRMPIQWLCTGSAKEGTPGDGDTVETTCPAGQACVAGVCKDTYVDPSSLETYVENLVFGTAANPDACLDVLACFTPSVVAEIDLDACTLPTPAGDPANVNLALVDPLDGAGTCAKTGGTCFLPLDADARGGFVVDGALVRMPPAICEKLRAGLFYGVAVSTACLQKTPPTPLCSPYGSIPPRKPIADDAPVPVAKPGYLGVDGGVVASADGVAKLNIPAQSIAASALFRIDEASAPSSPGLVGKAYAFTPDGTVFAAGREATLSFDAAALGLTEPETLRIARSTGTGWELLETTFVDGIVTAPTPHLSVYGLVRQVGTGGAAGAGGAGAAGAGGAAGEGLGGAAGESGAGGEASGAGGIAGASGAAGAEAGGFAGAGGAGAGGNGGEPGGAGGFAGAGGAGAGGNGGEPGGAGGTFGGEGGVGGQGGFAGGMAGMAGASSGGLCIGPGSTDDTCATQFPDAVSISMVCAAQEFVHGCDHVACANGSTNPDNRLDNGCECPSGSPFCANGRGPHAVLFVESGLQDYILNQPLDAFGVAPVKHELLPTAFAQGAFRRYGLGGTELVAQEQATGQLVWLNRTGAAAPGTPYSLLQRSPVPELLGGYDTTRPLRVSGGFQKLVVSLPPQEVAGVVADPVLDGEALTFPYAPAIVLAGSNGVRKLATWVDDAGVVKVRWSKDQAGPTAWDAPLTIEAVSGKANSFVGATPNGSDVGFVDQASHFCHFAVGLDVDYAPVPMCEAFTMDTTLPFSMLRLPGPPGELLVAWQVGGDVDGVGQLFLAEALSGISVSLGNFGSPILVEGVDQTNIFLYARSKNGIDRAVRALPDLGLVQPFDSVFAGPFRSFAASRAEY